ncbi:MAG: outer membrane protein transport protein [Betaproteobacteria bacterium]|nr:outer membrane protein transport protein [Betaproteobacteria bacterium]
MSTRVSKLTKPLFRLTALALLFAPAAAFATDGYFQHGYGLKAKGMGGAATAMTLDSFGGANNPASMVWVGDRLDVGLDWFSPKRSAERTGSAAGLNGSAESGKSNFYIPEFGYNKMLGWNMSVGVSVYGNGGMNTTYPGGQISTAPGSTFTCPGFLGFPPSRAGTTPAPYNLLCGSGPLGVDLSQLVIAPTFAMKINKQHSFGISPLIGYQRFKADGLQGFSAFSNDQSKLTNNGYDSSTGFGVRLGWLGRVSDSVTLGAAYSTKIRMKKFDKYAGLFAEQGDFDMPENWNIGIAFKPASKFTVALDYQRINYGGVASVGNPSTNNGGGTAASFFINNSLGCNSCRGFGWSNVDVVKLGVEYRYDDRWTLRAGYNRSKNPIQARDVTFNILAPGVVQNHVTLGTTYDLDKQSELTLSYMHAYQKSVSGTSLFQTWTPGFGLGTGGTETIKMYQNALGIAYGRKFE